MLMQEVVTMVSDELRDAKTTKYSNSSIVFKLKEAMTQFVSDSSILKNTVLIDLIENQDVYNLPVYGIPYTHDSIVDDIHVPTYLSLIRLGRVNNTDPNNVSNKIMRPNSTYEQDEVGVNINQSGLPVHHHNDELSFYKFGVWPIPNADAALEKLKIDYVRDVMYKNSSGDFISRSEANLNSILDEDIPEEFLSKIYLLVCFLRLKNSTDPNDVQKAANYKTLYEIELLAKALESGSHMDRYNQLKVQE